MKVILYTNKSDSRTVNKSLTELATVNCSIYNSNSVMSPQLLLETQSYSFNANYCYIEELARYYYITDWKLEQGLRIILNLKVDTLMSFRGELTKGGTVIRQENIGINYVRDEQLPLLSSRKTATIKFDSGEFNINTADSTSYNYILNVAGGGESSSLKGGDDEE